MESFAAYSHALTALAFWAILISVLGALSTMGRTPEGRCDCGKPKRNYDDVVYRRERAFMNGRGVWPVSGIDACGGAAWRACVLGEPLCGAIRGGAGRDGRSAYRDNQPADAVAVLYAGAGLHSGLGGIGDFRSLLRHD